MGNESSQEEGYEGDEGMRGEFAGDINVGDDDRIWPYLSMIEYVGDSLPENAMVHAYDIEAVRRIVRRFSVRYGTVKGTKSIPKATARDSSAPAAESFSLKRFQTARRDCDKANGNNGADCLESDCGDRSDGDGIEEKEAALIFAFLRLGEQRRHLQTEKASSAADTVRKLVDGPQHHKVRISSGVGSDKRTYVYRTFSGDSEAEDEQLGLASRFKELTRDDVVAPPEYVV